MTSRLIVIDSPKALEAIVSDVAVITPSVYFSDEKYQSGRYKVLNLCRSYQYQSEGYYVSLLAEARGHHVMPDIATLQDFRFPSLVREDAEDFEDLLQQVFKKETAEKVELLICFGETENPAYSKAGALLFNLFQVPLLKATFTAKGKWSLTALKPVHLKELKSEQSEWFGQSLAKYTQGKNRLNKQYARKKFDMAILVNPEEHTPPSDKKALDAFAKAGEKVGFNVDFITKNDFAKLIQYDALFIRETTNVNHHTFKFAKKAESEGLVVMDDPVSILKCTNKVYLSEILRAHKVPTPRYWLLKNEKSTQKKLSDLPYPIILKQPDGAFSLGVKKAKNEEECKELLKQFFHSSDLVIAQEYLPTDFDWRIGVLAGKALYVCKYYMAKGHWQIVNWQGNKEPDEGMADTMLVEDAPEKLIALALKATSLIGDGLYGVDIKQQGDKYYVIEINDNPSIDAGIEDSCLKGQLYQKIMQEFWNRLI